MSMFSNAPINFSSSFGSSGISLTSSGNIVQDPSNLYGFLYSSYGGSLTAGGNSSITVGFPTYLRS